MQGFCSDSASGEILFNQNTPVDFESSVFVGKFAMHMKGLDTTPPGVFEGRRRLQHIVIQVGRIRSSVSKEAVHGNMIPRQEALAVPWLLPGSCCGWHSSHALALPAFAGSSQATHACSKHVDWS